ncbi:MAG: metallophosphoesterase [bacterium]|nr:metallophosphoesterase [Candidatus Colisoma equi]
MDRRQFIGGFGGLVATAALPSFAGDPSVFPKRGKFERLVLAYQHIQAEATKPFTLLHISDTHFTAAYAHEPDVKQELKRIRTETFGGRQEEALRDSLAWAKLNTDYVLHTGDLIDWQSEANFDLVRKYYGGIALGTMGNHEYSPSMWLTSEKETKDDAWRAKSAKALSSAYPFDISFHAEVVNGVNFVMIDDVFGMVTERQVGLFAAEVKKGLPIILCMHVPFYTPDIWLASTKFWSYAGHKATGRTFSAAAVPEAQGDYKAQQTDKVTREFIAYLKSEKLLKGILAGHLHITVQERFSPTAMQYVVGGNFMFHGQEVLFT